LPRIVGFAPHYLSHIEELAKEDSFMSQTGSSIGVLSVALALIILAVVFSPVPLLAQSNTSFGLGSSVLIDPQGTAYISNQEGAITAIKLDSGTQIWTTPKGKAYRPLAVSGKFLAAMQEGAGPKTGKHLGVALLQLLDGSEHMVNWVEVPPAAWASVKNGLGSSLRTSAAIGADGKVTISWVSEWQREMRGTAPDDDETPGGARLAAARVEAHSGSVEIDSSGRIVPLSQAVNSAQAFQTARQDLPEDQRMKGLPETQYISADGRHILVSEITGNDNDLNKYRWTIYPVASKEPVGVIAAPFPTAPFFVSGAAIIYQLRPYMVRDQGDRLVRSPLKLIAIDLRSGGKLWEHAILDTEYYGPFPP
jgi:outer membrane protein assembly factor BamB